MYSAEWKSALVCQFIIFAISLIMAKSIFDVPFKVTFVAAILLNIIPIIKAPGFSRWLFLQDLLILPLAFLLLSRYVPFRLFMIACLAIFLWPFLCTVFGVTIERHGYAWAMYLYRRFGFLVFLTAGACGVIRGITARHFFDACTVLWFGMALAGLLQYFGVLNVDFTLETILVNGVSVAGSAQSQHGFLGFNRGAVGVCGATIATYCITVLFFDRQMGFQRFGLYTLTIATTYIVVIFSGSRTGLVACFSGLVFVLLRCLLRLGQVRLARIIIFYLIGFAIIACFVVPATDAVSGRIDKMFSESLDKSSGGRVAIQIETVKHVFGSLRPAIIGMGGGSTMHFMRTFRGLAHSHSEYVDTLWETGIPGLLLYLVFLWQLYKNMRPVPGEPSDIMGIAGQAVLFVGMIGGLAIGNFLVSSSRLATFGYAMLFAYGLILNRFGQNDYSLVEFDGEYYWLSESDPTP